MKNSISEKGIMRLPVLTLSLVLLFAFSFELLGCGVVYGKDKTAKDLSWEGIKYWRNKDYEKAIG